MKEIAIINRTKSVIKIPLEKKIVSIVPGAKVLELEDNEIKELKTHYFFKKEILKISNTTDREKLQEEVDKINFEQGNV
ncbi:Uncharacterised protein [Sebaldella termitidis]|uniref:Uncharacterized protein n=1 Tax=Sebaldella termitidis (strain ATCC 33386 / NCTC 11300) TaxID=526218 RepID=D1AN75_SEBTE|nr:hypothetical protein [Sebaldella termitidis]ACZ09679.1 hypothetical protein Sterm_2835 [Sebaldella termitidis ATCC 33386]SUI25011.1 Uncharacterised protein [Sebaldella termitidis]